MNTQRNFQFVPAYYEWHLIDNNGNTLHNMVDPLDELFHEDGLPMNLEEVTDMCAEELHAAENAYAEGNDYNGIMLSEGLSAIEEKKAAQVMAQALYNYYLA